MIDLHLHLLPAVDDGPADLAQSLALARALVSAGISQAIVTPHVNQWTIEVLPDLASIARRTAALQRELDAESIPLIIQPGGECYLTLELVTSAQQGMLPTWGRTPSVLVELSTAPRLLYIGQVLSQIQACGIQVVLAHPERYGFVRAQPESLGELIEMGVLLQVTAAAFQPRRGNAERFAEILLRRGLVHLVASDAHSAAGVPGVLGGVARLRELGGEALVEQLYTTNPAAILAGAQDIQPARTNVSGRRRRFWLPFGS